MALNLFKRVDSVKGLFAVESISLIYNALTTIMVLILFPRMDHPVIMLFRQRAGICGHYVCINIFVSQVSV